LLWPPARQCGPFVYLMDFLLFLPELFFFCFIFLVTRLSHCLVKPTSSFFFSFPPWSRFGVCHCWYFSSPPFPFGVIYVLFASRMPFAGAICLPYRFFFQFFVHYPVLILFASAALFSIGTICFFRRDFFVFYSIRLWSPVFVCVTATSVTFPSMSPRFVPADTYLFFLASFLPPFSRLCGLPAEASSASGCRT